MARQRVPAQVNQFIGGLNTEASPLNYPINATVSELNCSLLKDGSRRRRLGFDREDNAVTINTSIVPSTTNPKLKMFVWDKPGGVADKTFIVVQAGSTLRIHDTDNGVLSTLVDTISLGIFLVEVSLRGFEFSMANISGDLVVVTGDTQVNIITYDGVTKEFASTRRKLLVRDFWGVEAYGMVGGTNYALSDRENIQRRPSDISYRHRYNLCNQGFGLQRVTGASDSTTVVDPIAAFYAASGNTVYPSNADNASQFIGPNVNFSSNRTVDRYRSTDHFTTTPTTSDSPKGAFIIDFIYRGLGREAALDTNKENNPVIEREHPSLFGDFTLIDRSRYGPRVCAAFAGRVWYAGFTSDGLGFDNKSPKVSSYVLFSQSVVSQRQITHCYQEADPTSNSDPDIIDTDGGFINLDGAYNIRKMVVLQASLFVFAENGIWEIRGGDSVGFTATNYIARKVSNEGCVSGDSVVLFEQTLLYWGRQAIYAIVLGEGGEYVVQDLTKDTIQTVYQSISEEDKQSTKGYYDYTENAFRWIYGTSLSHPSTTKELLLHSRFNSFCQNEITSASGVSGPVAALDGVTLNLSYNPHLILIGVQEAVSGFDQISYTFGHYKNENPLDWVSFGGGLDSPAHLQTGFVTGGDARLRKEVPRLTTHFSRTEDEDLGGVESSCILSSRWDWSTAVGTSRWSTPRQAYRPVRTSDGHDHVTTKNRIRGSGKSVSFRFESEPGKTFRLYGWEHNLESGEEE